MWCTPAEWAVGCNVLCGVDVVEVVAEERGFVGAELGECGAHVSAEGLFVSVVDRWGDDVDDLVDGALAEVLLDDGGVNGAHVLFDDAGGDGVWVGRYVDGVVAVVEDGGFPVAVRWWLGEEVVERVERVL